MHAADLVDLAGFVSTHAGLLTNQHSKWAVIAAERYWAASKCRLDRWGRSLKLFSEDLKTQHEVYTPWPAIELVANEILTSEMLTRVWAAVACIHDAKFQDDVFESVARSVLVGHMEARHRVLKLIVIGNKARRPEAAKLNLRRMKIERWTDLLLGNLNHSLAMQFGFDAERVDEFAREKVDYADATESASWHLMLQSSHKSFLAYRNTPAINGDLNEEVFAAVMSCFPAEVFDSSGEYHSLWLLRMSCMADETEKLLERFFRMELSADGV